jgi:Trk K+ transport system NAD-binding subunit
MDSWRRRIGYYIAVLVGLMIGYALVYWWGMVNLEGAEGTTATFLHAVQVVVETFTTTGFGSDAPWQTSFMNVLVILMDVTGTAAIFLALPLLLFPALEEALSTSVPATVADDLSDHVIIAAYTPRTETLTGELDARGVDWVIVEPDRERAIELHEDGYEVVNADPDEIDGLEAVNLPQARALVADLSDQVDTSIVLTAKELAEDVEIVSVVEDPDRARYHDLAGADTVLSPRPLLGRRLAEMVTGGVATNAGDGIEIGEDFEVAELLVHQGSWLAGTALADTDLREQTGVNVIGAWVRGEFETPVDPDATLEPGTILLVTGEPIRLERLTQHPKVAIRQFERGETIVVGHGKVGQAVTATLEASGRPYTVIDRDDGPGVDVVGKASDLDTLQAAGIDDARSVILAIPDDTEAEFATLVMRDRNHNLDIAARTEGVEAVRKFYRAGANYALSLAKVTGRMIASAVLDDEDVITRGTQIEVIRTRAPALAGQTLAEAQVPTRTGCTVIAAERDGEVLTDLGPEFRVHPGDELVVAGTDEGTNRFSEAFS